jgi:hypothetical protein
MVYRDGTPRRGSNSGGARFLIRRLRHVICLRSMVVLGLVETFERFLKETAAVCVDQLSGRVLEAPRG